MPVPIEDIKKLRAETDAAVSDCRQALEESGGDFEKAIKILSDKAIKKADKKADREVKSGFVFFYIHHTGKVGSMLSLACETDFVAKNEEFQKLGKELVLHICASRPESTEELLAQDYIRDPSKKIQELIKSVIGKLGENIQVVDFTLMDTNGRTDPHR